MSRPYISTLLNKGDSLPCLISCKTIVTVFHGRISDGERYVGTVAGRIGYRAIYV
jgi:hypothetical protein